MSIFGKIRERFQPEWEKPVDHEKTLSELFGRTPEALHATFSDRAVVLRTDDLPAYPRVEYLGQQGFHAFMWAQNMEATAFPKFYNMVRGDSEDEDFRHFRHGQFTSFVSTNVEFLARNAYLLTNDVGLIDRLSKERFSPNPPWIMYPDLGPFTAYNQGEPEYWDRFVWTPFWSSLTPAERDAYIASRSTEALTYMSREEWAEWVYKIRMSDPEYKPHHGL
jgi:hypothetical protein